MASVFLVAKMGIFDGKNAKMPNAKFFFVCHIVAKLNGTAGKPLSEKTKKIFYLSNIEKKGVHYEEQYYESGS